MAGRPKKDASERRSKPLRILLTESEREALNRFAWSRGLDTSTWARVELLKLIATPGVRRKKSGGEH